MVHMKNNKTSFRLSSIKQSFIYIKTVVKSMKKIPCAES